jgi:hypothetical protein
MVGGSWQYWQPKLEFEVVDGKGIHRPRRRRSIIYHRLYCRPPYSCEPYGRRKSHPLLEHTSSCLLHASLTCRPTQQISGLVLLQTGEPEQSGMNSQRVGQPSSRQVCAFMHQVSYILQMRSKSIWSGFDGFHAGTMTPESTGVSVSVPGRAKASLLYSMMELASYGPE